MLHSDQDQHIVPQVYLKKFGYIDPKTNQWKVSVLKRGETFTRQKNIKSFLAIKNLFDINHPNPTIDIRRSFEDLNSNLESKYNGILSDLEKNQCLSNESSEYLIQFISNLVVRSTEWRNLVFGILNRRSSKTKEYFLKMIIGSDALESFLKIDEDPLYSALMKNSPEDALNIALIQFTAFLYKRIQYLDIILMESQSNKPWWTSSNPVVLHNITMASVFFSKESELYFPLSPKFLAYLHFKDSTDKVNPLRLYQTNKVFLATEEQCEEFRKIIIDNQSDYIIAANKIEYPSHN